MNLLQAGPETLYKAPRNTKPINWEALHYIVDTATGSKLEKQLMRPRFIKAVKRGGIEALTPTWRYRYCAARLYLGDFSDYWGWEFRDFDKINGDPSGWASKLYFTETWLPKWDGQYVDTLLILSEQGIGDEVFWASMIPEAMIRVKQVIYECDPRLHSLLERSFRGLQCDREHPFEERRPGDAYIPAAELLRMFRRDKSHFPRKAYLKPDPKKVEELEKYRGRVGISWKARVGSIDPMKYLIENPLSLQYKQTHEAVETPPIDLFNDIEGIVALCSVLDKVVTVPTSVHHFAGALGKRVEIIMPEESNEAENQGRWDTPIGKSFYYKDVEVFKDLKSWRH